MLNTPISAPPFLQEQALIYHEIPLTDFSWLSPNEYEYDDDFEYSQRVAYDYEFAEELDIDFVFEAVAPYNANMPRLQKELQSCIAKHDPTFSQKVLEIIRLQDKDEIEIYKRAYLDRKLFSKLRNNIFYQPSRNTAIALVFALELDLDTAQDLLRRAGFALSHATVSDLIIEYFLTHRIYNIFLLNEILYDFGQPPIFD